MNQVSKKKIYKETTWVANDWKTLQIKKKAS